MAEAGGRLFVDVTRIVASSASRAGLLGLLGKSDPLIKDALETVLDAFHGGLSKMSPKMAESLDPSAVMFWFWDTYPFTLGSYASAKPGQYTTMLDVAGEPALDGRLQFAGEHTSSDFLGYMNGGVQSGNRAAAALVETLALHK